jgi:hypothetical protein
VRPSKRRLMPSKRSPQVAFLSGLISALDGFFFPDPACNVKTATPVVTARTTRYLYKGYRFLNSVMCKNITGRSLHDFARMKVM